MNKKTRLEEVEEESLDDYPKDKKTYGSIEKRDHIWQNIIYDESGGVIGLSEINSDYRTQIK